MTYTEKKRSMFLGLPWTFTSYTVTDEIITINNGLLRKEENDCYLYKVIDVRLESTLLERMLGLGTIHCFTGDVTDPDLKHRLHSIHVNLMSVQNQTSVAALFRLSEFLYISLQFPCRFLLLFCQYLHRYFGQMHICFERWKRIARQRTG